MQSKGFLKLLLRELRIVEADSGNILRLVPFPTFTRRYAFLTESSRSGASLVNLSVGPPVMIHDQTVNATSLELLG